MDSLRIYPEGDAIALVMNNHPERQHSADLGGSAQRLGFLRISELHDPNNRAALKQRIAKYFAQTPFTPELLEHIALDQSMTAVLTGAMASDAQKELWVQEITHFLEYEGQDSVKLGMQKAFRHALGDLGLPVDPHPFSQAMSGKAQSGELIQTINAIRKGASERLRATFFSDPSSRIAQEFGRISAVLKESLASAVSSEEKAQLCKTAARKTFLQLTSFVPEAEALQRFESFWADHGAELIENETAFKFTLSFLGSSVHHPELDAWLKERLPVAEPARMKQIFDQYAIKAEQSTHLGTNFCQRANAFLTTQIWKDNRANPEKAAEALLQDIEKYRDVKYPYPETEVVMRGKQHMTKVEDCLPHLPPAARRVIEHDGLDIMVGKDAKGVKHLLPRPEGLGNLIAEALQPGLAGASMNRVLYLNSSFGDYPHLVAEEMLHGVDEKLGHYTMSEPWKKAFDKDFAAVGGNKTAKKLLKAYGKQQIALGETKGNGAFTMVAERFPSERQMEALPDMMHLERAAQEMLEKNGKISTGWFSSVSTVDEAMHAAFPNLWKLYQGAPQGKFLFQSADGTVHAVAAGESAKEGAVPVKSFVETCEEFVAGLGKSASVMSGRLESQGARTSGLVEKILQRAAAAAVHVR